MCLKARCFQSHPFVLAQLKELSSLDRVRVVVTCRDSASLVTENAADGFNVWNYPVADKSIIHIV